MITENLQERKVYETGPWTDFPWGHFLLDLLLKFLEKPFFENFEF